MTEIPQEPAAASVGPPGAPPIEAVPGGQLRPLALDRPEPKKALPVQRGPRAGRPSRERRSLDVKAPTLITRSLKDALAITDQEVLAYLPTDDDMVVGEALVSGASTLIGITGYSGLSAERIRRVLNNPVAMAYISQRVEALFKTRAAVVDAAVYLRAAGGDVAAAKLFYERMRLLVSQNVRVDHVYSGGVNISALPDDELARIVLEKGRLLPKEFHKVIDVPVEVPPEP